MSSFQKEREAELSLRRFCLAAAAHLVRRGTRQETIIYGFLDEP